MNSPLPLSVDGLDREILRVLQKRRPLVSRHIARFIGISAVAVAPRLRRLKQLGILKISHKAKTRVFTRSFGRKKVEVSSPRSIFWDLDLVEEKR